MSVRSSALPAAILFFMASFVPSQAQIAADGDTANRLNAIEEQLRMLTGEVDRLSLRVRQLEAAAGVAGAGAVAAPAANTGVPQPVGEGGLTQLGAPPANLGQLRTDQNGQPLDLTGLSNAMPAGTVGSGSPAPVLTPPSAVATASDGPPPRDAYDVAYSHVLRGDYAAAEQAFGEFIERYPDNELVPNAKFWIGESFFQRGDYHNAARAFLDSSQSHPDSAKAPESLLKLGLSLAALQQREPACSTLNELMRRYPRAEPSVHDQAQAEIRALGC